MVELTKQSQAAAAVDALNVLAKSFSANQQPLQAVRCLEAICHSSAQMPAAAAKTRLQLARLLLDHTQNISEAAQHLQQAVSPALSSPCSFDIRPEILDLRVLQQLLLNQIPAQYSLKCQVFSELGRCQRYLSRPKLEMQLYQRALHTCANGKRSAERLARF